MMHVLQIPSGVRSNAPPLVKHAIRFGRRLREHGIWTYGFPVVIDDTSNVCRATVGQRSINIHDDGSFTPSLLRGATQDHAAFVTQRQRMHAIFLNIAAESRRAGKKRAAFNHLKFAIEERLP